jgi:small subunit ribosomal protein S6
MPVELYETLFLLDSNRLAADADAVRGQLHATLERYGAQIDVSRPWDDRKLAYPIKKQKKGAYHIVYYRLDSLKQADIERDLKINESVLRHMTLNVDPKWADIILDAARNDTSMAFAIRGMQEEADPSNVTPNLGDAGGPDGEALAAATGGRRPRRDTAEKPE